MGFLSKIFGRKASEPDDDPNAEHAVIVSVVLSADGLGADEDRQEMTSLEDALDQAIRASDAGELDGDEYGAGSCEIYMYGPNADRLWEAIAPVLEERPFRKGSYAIRRYGGVGCGREERIDLHWDG